MSFNMRMLPLALLLLVSLVLALGLFNKPMEQKEASGEKTRLIGFHVAPFEVPALGSDKPFTPDVWKGQIIVLNVFASWCVPCAAEHEVLMKLAKSGKVAVYGIAWKDKPENVMEWLKSRGNPFQMIGLDTVGKSTVPLALSGVPETFVIDTKGMIAFNQKAAINDDMVDNVILPLVESLRAGNAAPGFH